jgi:hypothetical protein
VISKGRRRSKLEVEWGRVSENGLSLGTLGHLSLRVTLAADAEKCGDKYMRRALCAWFQGALPYGARLVTEQALERPGDLLSGWSRSEQQGEEEARLWAIEHPRIDETAFQ